MTLDTLHNLFFFYLIFKLSVHLYMFVKCNISDIIGICIVVVDVLRANIGSVVHQEISTNRAS